MPDYSAAITFHYIPFRSVIFRMADAPDLAEIGDGAALTAAFDLKHRQQRKYNLSPRRERSKAPAAIFLHCALAVVIGANGMGLVYS